MTSWVIDGQLARGCRPGYSGERGRSVSAAAIDDWLEEHKVMGIRSIICLLADGQLQFYENALGGLLTRYREAGFEVGHVPALDHQHPPLTQQHLKEIWHAYQSLSKPVLVHCSAGIDRTGLAIDFICRQLRATHEGSIVVEHSKSEDKA